MQRAYISALCDIAARDARVLSLLSDSGTDYDVLFNRDFPDRVINFGISEEHKTAAAAGLAMCGKIPFVYTAGAFLAYRAYEFIRNDICFQQANVKLVGMGSGLAWSTLGPSHHACEDIAALRALPMLTLLCPATPHEVKGCVEAAYAIRGPVYIRLGMSGEKEFYHDAAAFDMGDISMLRPEGDILALSTGSILEEVMSAADALREKGIHVAVGNVHTLKPFDGERFRALLSGGYRAVVTVEEHNVMGGLGGIIAEALAECAWHPPLVRVGLADRFATGYGTLAQVRRMNGLDAESIAGRITEAFARTTR